MKLQNILLAVTLLFVSINLSAQTCSDGIKNGNEVGVDCGGSCPGICDDYLTDDAYKLTNGTYDASGIFINVKGGNPNEEIIYLQFDVPVISQIDGVELELRSQFPNADDIEIYATDDPTWSESNLSAANAPVIVGSPISSSGTIYNTNIIKWTLDKCAFSSNTTISLIVKRLSSNTNQVKFLSQEQGGGGNQAKLIFNRITPPGSCGGGGNTPPTVSFVSPMDGQSFTAGTNLPVEASASDDDTVTGVEFFYGGNSQGTDDTAPYQWMVSNLVQGTHMLKVVATDNDGATSEEEISIMVNAGGGGSGAWQSGTAGAIYYSSGNVGIGVASPSQPLHVAGEIYASRVRVKTEAGGADFVFEEDYGLMPLEEVEAYVKKHKHLPEIPSEKEMMENDLQLGDFSIKLLQKVEELTLYLIELKKENEALKQENQEIKKELEALKQK